VLGLHLLARGRVGQRRRAQAGIEPLLAQRRLDHGGVVELLLTLEARAAHRRVKAIDTLYCESSHNRSCRMSNDILRSCCPLHGYPLAGSTVTGRWRPPMPG